MWDLFPGAGSPGDPEYADFDQEILAVMAETLQIESDACRESALHGLGHWQANYPQKVRGIIDLFLNRDGLPPELRQYALNARMGAVQ